MVFKISFHIQDFNFLLYLVGYHSSISFYTFKGKSFRGLFGTPLNVKDLSKPRRCHDSTGYSVAVFGFRCGTKLLAARSILGVQES